MSIFLAKTNERMQILCLENLHLERSWLIFQANTAILDFAFSVIFKSFTDFRFQQNHDTANTLQSKLKMRNAHAFAQPKT